MYIYIHSLKCYRSVAGNFVIEPSFFSLCTVGLNLVLKLISLLYPVKLHMGCSAGETVFSRINRRNESQAIPHRYITES